MKSTDKPSLIETVIASGANASYVRTIPKTQTKSGSGEMSLDLGWPPECAIPVAAGGKYPQMADANGVLNLLSAAVQQLQARFLGPYNADFATAIGGYPLNAIVSDTTAGKFWVSTAEDNTTEPGADGASWQSLFAGYATNEALKTETTNRTNVDTNLQNQINNRVMKSGDTMSGPLTLTGEYGVATGYSWSEVLTLENQYTGSTAQILCTTQYGVDTAVRLKSTWGNNKNTVLDLHQDGTITTTHGTVAFDSDISNLQNQINGKQPAGNYVETNKTNAKFYCWNITASSGDTINFPITFTDASSIVLSLTAQDTGRGSWLTYSNLTTTSFQLFGRFMRHGNLDQMPQTQVSIMVYGW